MGTWNYTYDTLNRLSTATNSSGPYVTENSGALVYGCWTYDAFADRTMESIPSTIGCTSSPTPTYWATYNTSNQVTGTGLMTAGYTYDAAGDITGDGQNAYLYDGAGRICAVKNVNSGIMTQYVYDGEGNRVAKGTLSSWPTACQTPTSGHGFTLSVQYVIGLGGEQLSELTATNGWSHTNVFAGGGLLATYEGTDTVFDLTDWQGTKRGETSAAGCLGSWMSLPYGNSLTQAGTCADASEHHYTGKVRDSETGYASGNDDFGARYFASSEGRWLSPDWAAGAEAVPYASYDSPQSLNLYAFVGNNPISRTDPDGHSPYGAQMTCSDGQSGGQCGVGTDPFSNGISSDVDRIGCAEGEADCRSNPCMSLGYNSACSGGRSQDSGQHETPSQSKNKEKHHKGHRQLTYHTIRTNLGSAAWVVQWQLTEPSKSGGYIIQNVTLTDANGTVLVTYWEAWKVPAKSEFTTFAPHDPFDDEFKTPSGVTETGTARFYEGLPLPDSFKENNSATKAGMLPSTADDPHLSTNNATAPVTRTWTGP
jgi:RHS repeat-associated protein